MSSVIFNGIGLLLPFFLYLLYKQAKISLIPASRLGVGYSVAAGVCIAAFSIVLVKALEKGNVSYVLPLLYGGAIILGSLLGILLLKEKVNWLQVGGIVVIACGIGMIALGKLFK